MRRFFQYVRGFAASAPGAGADGLGLAMPQTLPLEDGFNVPGYAVRRSFMPYSGGFNLTQQSGPQVDLKGNGLGTYDALDLQRLAQLSQGN